MRPLILLVALTLGMAASAQPQEEPVPEGVFGLIEVRAFLGSPLWSAWKLPSSKLLLAYAQGPASNGEPPPRQLVVLDAKGKLDAKRTQAVQAALEQADPSGQCLAVGEGRMPLLMPLGSKGVVLQASTAPERSCLFTWNPRRSAIEVQGAGSVRDFCGPSGCSPKECWLTEDCWLPEGPDLDAARRGFHASALAQELRKETAAPGDAVLAATLPGSGRVLLWVASWRQADAADPAKGKDSRIFVYEPRKKTLDLAASRKLAVALQRAVDECMGLGTVMELQQSGKGVTLRQDYAAGKEHLSCSTGVRWQAGRFAVEGRASEGSGGPGAPARAQEGPSDENAQALELWKANRPELAIAIWERLYTHANYQDPSFAEVCDNLGHAYWARGEFKKAEDVLLDCEKSFPARATLQLHLGDVYRDTRRAKEARERYQHFLEMEGGTPEQRRAAEKNLDRLKARP
jgi:tetratricopeptide (TPR) repeat protein